MNSDPLCRWLCAALLLPWFLLAAPTWAADSLDLPELGSRQQGILDSQRLQTFRNAFLSSLYAKQGVIEDPLILLWLDRLGQSLALHASPQRYRIQVLPIRSDAINAFAGPGGIIGINRGLILAARNTDEVAAVIAHEIGHVSQHHLLRRFANADKDNLAAFATLLAALLVGQLDPQAGMATFYAGNALNLEQQLKFSRHHETEADAVGIRLLAESGYNPNAMATFFQTLQQRSLNDPSQVPEVLRTHPVTPHRIAAAENRAHTLISEPHDTLHPMPPLTEVQARLAPSFNNQDCLARASAEKSLSADCQADLQQRAREDWFVLGTFLAWAEAHAPKRIPPLLWEADSHYPDNAALQLMAARIAFNHGNIQHALRRLNAVGTNAPPALQSLAARLQARILKQAGRRDASLLALADAAYLRGQTSKARYLIKQIDAKGLSARERLQFDRLKKTLSNTLDTPDDYP